MTDTTFTLILGVLVGFLIGTAFTLTAQAVLS